jgi:hypothetical protein
MQNTPNHSDGFIGDANNGLMLAAPFSELHGPMAQRIIKLYSPAHHNASAIDE